MFAVKYYHSYFCIAILSLYFSCVPAPTKNEATTQTPTKSEVKQTSNISNASNEKQDSSAIGEIYFGMNQKNFNSAKKDLLTNYNPLGGLRIADMKGYFYNGKLVRIIITSIAHNKIEDDFAWSSLYRSKYPDMSGNEDAYVTFYSHQKGNYKFSVTDKDVTNTIPPNWDYDMGLEEEISARIFDSLERERIQVMHHEAECAKNRTEYHPTRYSRIDLLDQKAWKEYKSYHESQRENLKKGEFERAKLII